MFFCFSFKVSPITFFFTVYWAIKTKYHTAWNCETSGGSKHSNQCYMAILYTISPKLHWRPNKQYPCLSPSHLHFLSVGWRAFTGDVRRAGSNSTSSCLLLQLLSYEGWRQVNGQCQRWFFGVLDDNGGILDIWRDIVFLLGDELPKIWCWGDLVGFY